MFILILLSHILYFGIICIPRYVVFFALSLMNLVAPVVTFVGKWLCLCLIDSGYDFWHSQHCPPLVLVSTLTSSLIMTVIML